VSIDEELPSVNALQALRLLISQDDDGLRQYVVTHLGVGDIWWIPDEVTGFAQKERHPWVIVKGYHAHRATVIASPRTSHRKNLRRGIMTPAGVLPGLDRSGLVDLSFRRSFSARSFREFEYIGRLSDAYIQKIQEFLATLARGKTTR